MTTNNRLNWITNEGKLKKGEMMKCFLGVLVVLACSVASAAVTLGTVVNNATCTQSASVLDEADSQIENPGDITVGPIQGGTATSASTLIVDDTAADQTIDGTTFKTFAIGAECSNLVIAPDTPANNGKSVAHGTVTDYVFMKFGNVDAERDGKIRFKTQINQILSILPPHVELKIDFKVIGGTVQQSTDITWQFNPDTATWTASGKINNVAFSDTYVGHEVDKTYDFTTDGDNNDEVAAAMSVEVMYVTTDCTENGYQLAAVDIVSMLAEILVEK